MKYLMMISLFLGVSVNLNAAVTGVYGGVRNSVWRSTQNCDAHNFGILSTGTIIIHSVRVSSAAVGYDINSSLTIFNTTTTPFNGGAGAFSTGTIQMTYVPPGSPVGQEPQVYDVIYSSGVVIKKQGVACTEVLWDYLIPRMPYESNSWTPVWRP